MTDLCFFNGRFLTLDPAKPEVAALSVRGGRIVGSGDAPQPGERGIDLGGRTAIPGPVDAHCHLVSYGMTRIREADLRGCRSLREVGERLEAHRRARGIQPGSGRWLLGRGFDQDVLEERRWPGRHDLDRIAADVPVRITRVCGHALVANTAALRAAGLDPTARRDGLPEGVLTEERMEPLLRAIPEPDAREWRDAARLACAEAARAGFVGVHCLMANAAEVAALVDLRREEGLPVRVRMILPYALLEHAAALGLRTGFGDEQLALGGIKLFADGSLGARTAALRRPYSDDPTTSGELLHPPEELARRVRAITAAGFQACIHAIGDRAMEVALDAIEAGAPPGARPFPPRIEHASVIDAGILRRMRALGVGAAIQPQFARSDRWVPERLGPERARWCYAFRSLWEAGVPLAGSTDCPVELLDARAAIGQLLCGPPWCPEEALPLDAALRIFSEGSYRLLGCPEGTGRLVPGQPADFVVLEEDPRTVPPEAVERIPVAMTVVGGRVVHAAGGIGAGA